MDIAQTYVSDWIKLAPMEYHARVIILHCWSNGTDKNCSNNKTWLFNVGLNDIRCYALLARV